MVTLQVWTPLKSHRTVRHMQCSDAYLCWHNTCFMAHKRSISLPAQWLQLSEHNKLSALWGRGDINTPPSLYIVAGCCNMSPTVTYWCSSCKWCAVRDDSLTERCQRTRTTPKGAQNFCHISLVYNAASQPTSRYDLQRHYLLTYLLT